MLCWHLKETYTDIVDSFSPKEKLKAIKVMVRIIIAFYMQAVISIFQHKRYFHVKRNSLNLSNIQNES